MPWMPLSYIIYSECLWASDLFLMMLVETSRTLFMPVQNPDSGIRISSFFFILVQYNVFGWGGGVSLALGCVFVTSDLHFVFPRLFQPHSAMYSLHDMCCIFSNPMDWQTVLYCTHVGWFSVAWAVVTTILPYMEKLDSILTSKYHIVVL